MTQWIETKLRYNKLKENGVVKKVTETYLVEALSVTEAEAQITREMQPYISGEFTVTAAKKSKIAEVITTDGEGFWYKLRVMFISFNERTGAAKLTPLLTLWPRHGSDASFSIAASLVSRKKTSFPWLDS